MGDFNATVVAIDGDLATSILVVPALLSLGGPEVRAKAANPQQDGILGQIGITYAFYPETEARRHTAHLVAQSFADYMDLGHGFVLVITTPDSKYYRTTLGELDVRRREGSSIAAIRDEDGEWSTAHVGAVLHEDGLITVIASVKTIARITRGRRQLWTHKSGFQGIIGM